LEKDEVFLKEYGNARRFFGDHESRLRKILEPDTETSEMRKMSSRQATLPARNRNGQQFSKSNIEPQAKASYVGPSRPSVDELDQSLDPLPANSAERKSAKSVAKNRPVRAAPRFRRSKSAPALDQSLRRKAKEARADHRRKRGAPAHMSLQPPQKRRKVDEGSMVPPGNSANADKLQASLSGIVSGDTRGESPQSGGDSRGDDWSESEAAGAEDPPPSDVSCNEEAAAQADEGVISEPGAEAAAGSASHSTVDGRQKASSADGEKGLPLAVLQNPSPRAEPARSVPQTPEATCSVEAEATQEEDFGEAAPEGSCTLEPSCKRINGPSRRVSGGGGARDTNAAADRNLHRQHGGERENTFLNAARTLLEARQQAEDDSWVPTAITHADSQWVTLRRLDGTSLNVSTAQSGCLMYLVYDPHSGDVRLVQIDSVKVKVSRAAASGATPAPTSTARNGVAEDMQDVSDGTVQAGGAHSNADGSLPEGIEEIDMQYHYVYSTASALRNCEQQDDRKTERKDSQGNVIVSLHRGGKFLKTVAGQGKLVYHAGDVRHRTRNGGLGLQHVVGRVAWLTAVHLIGIDDGKRDLRLTLGRAGVPRPEAKLLASDPLYIGEHFLEARPTEEPVWDDESEESEESDSEGLIIAPSRAPVRALLKAGNNGGAHTDSEDSDADVIDVPLAKRRRMPMQGPMAGSSRSLGGKVSCGKALEGRKGAKVARDSIEDSDDDVRVFADRNRHGSVLDGANDQGEREQPGGGASGGKPPGVGGQRGTSTRGASRRGEGAAGSKPSGGGAAGGKLPGDGAAGDKPLGGRGSGGRAAGGRGSGGQAAGGAGQRGASLRGAGQREVSSRGQLVASHRGAWRPRPQSI
jgi:hypothetical protein